MKYLLSIFAFLLFGVSVFGQETTAFPMSESSLLWKIEGPGVAKGSYLFGTMHLIEKEYFIFPEKLEKILKKSDLLVMEIGGMPNQLEAINLVKLQEGTFFDYFDSLQIDSIFVWAKSELKMDETRFRETMTKMKPFVVVQLATQMQFFGKTESYEMTFEQIARENNIEIKGLETVEQQMSIFNNLTKKQQAEMVMDGIRNTGKALEDTRQMEKLYVGQNVDSLYLMIEKEGGVLSEEQSVFLDARNANWIPQLKEIIATKKSFIAVGAGHLGGPNGLIRLMEKEGYTLVPVAL